MVCNQPSLKGFVATACRLGTSYLRGLAGSRSMHMQQQASHPHGPPTTPLVASAAENARRFGGEPFGLGVPRLGHLKVKCLPAVFAVAIVWAGEHSRASAGNDGGSLYWRPKLKHPKAPVSHVDCGRWAARAPRTSQKSKGLSRRKKTSASNLRGYAAEDYQQKLVWTMEGNSNII